MCMQVKLQHLVTIHVRSSAFGSKSDAGMFMKALAVQYDVWAENFYQRMISVGLPTTKAFFVQPSGVRVSGVWCQSVWCLV